MGMFDYVEYKIVCPVCKETITDFQTKSMRNAMDSLKIEDLPKGATFYSDCRKCKLWVEFRK